MGYHVVHTDGVMYTPPNSPAGMREARRIINDLRQRQGQPGQP